MIVKRNIQRVYVSSIPLLLILWAMSGFFCTSTNKVRIDNKSQQLSTGVAKNEISKDIVSKLSLSKQSFNPSRNDSVLIEFALQEDGKVTLSMMDEDGFVFKTLCNDSSVKKNKEYTFVWHGKDNSEVTIPDEVYYPVLEVKSRKQQFTLNPLLENGGVEIEANNFTFDERQQTISYDLPQPARVLIRAGIPKGVFLKTIVGLKPRLAGNVTEYWNGMDSDNIQYVPTLSGWVAGVTASYALSTPLVIAYGNKKQTHKEYRLLKNLHGKLVVLDSVKIKQQNYSAHFLRSIISTVSPQINLSMIQGAKKDKDGIYSISGQCMIRIAIDEKHKDFLDEQYEITIFIDNEFYSEEEVGYTPYNWLWRTHDVPAGEHIVTINLISMKDRVATKSIKVNIQK